MGRNVAAGMTGGLAYFLDEDNTFIPKVCARDPFHSSFSVFLLQMSVCMDYWNSFFWSGFPYCPSNVRKKREW